MKLGQVTGAVWGALRAPGLEHYKLLEIQPLDIGPGGTLVAMGDPIVAIDPLQAGPGDRVLVGHGSRIRDIILKPPVPTKEVVIAIVDDLEVNLQALKAPTCSSAR